MERTEDQIAEEAVKKFLAPKRKDRGELKRLRHHIARGEAAQKIAGQLSESSQEWLDRIDYYLAEQLRTALLGREAKRQEVRAVTDFLKSDIDFALNGAIDRGLELLEEEPKQMERLIEDVAVEVQQLVLRAKKEFSIKDELHRLEETYSLPAIDQWLRRKLCLIQLARFHQEVSRTIQLLVAKFEQAGRPDERRETIAKELVGTLREVAGRAIDRLQREGLEERIYRALELHVENFIEERCNPEALEALFSIE